MAQTINEKLHDLLWVHHANINRYVAGLGRLARVRMGSTENAMLALISEYTLLLQGVPITSKRGQKLLKQFERKLIAIRAEAWKGLTNEIETDVKRFAVVDHKAQVKLYDDVLPFAIGMTTVETGLVSSIVTTQPFDGRTLRQWMTSAQQADINRVLRAARIGLVNGEDLGAIVSRVIGTKRLKYRDGQARKAFTDAESNVITAVNGISNQISQELVKANADIIEKEVFAATLDIRTTKVCAGNDGKLFLVGQGPIPPLHMRCRSRRLPIVTEAAFGRRGMDPTFERGLVEEFARSNRLGQISKRGDLPYGYKTAYNKWVRNRRRELLGDVPAEVTFEQWMRNRTEAFQNEYFGKRKAEIFRLGKIPLHKFTTRDGYELTIEQLERLAS